MYSDRGLSYEIEKENEVEQVTAFRTIFEENEAAFRQ